MSEFSSISLVGMSVFFTDLFICKLLIAFNISFFSPDKNLKGVPEVHLEFYKTPYSYFAEV